MCVIDSDALGMNELVMLLVNVLVNGLMVEHAMGPVEPCVIDENANNNLPNNGFGGGQSFCTGLHAAVLI
jgi:hypothetical protein